MELEIVTLEDNFYQMEFLIASAQITDSNGDVTEYEFNDTSIIEELFEECKFREWVEVILFSETEDEDTIYQTVVFPIDIKSGWTAVVFYDEQNSCMYIPYNEKYKDSDEFAPVLFGGKSEVLKANTFDDLDEVIEFFKHIITHKKLPIDSKLQWVKEQKC